MLHNQILFISLFITFFVSTGYLTYFICKKDNYIGYNAKQMNKLKKFILAYVFPTFCVISIILTLVYFAIINFYTLLINIFAGFLFMIAISCFCNDYNYWGIFLALCAIIGCFSLYLINFIEVPKESEIIKVELTPYDEDIKEKESILLIFDTDTTSSTSNDGDNTDEYTDIISEIENTDDYDGELQEKIELYSFLMYDKAELRKKGIKLPISLFTDQYQTTEKEENYIEIKIEKLQVMNIYSYFEFFKQKENIKNSYDYRIVINENNLKIY